MSDTPASRALRALPTQVNHMKGVINVELYNVSKDAIYTKMGHVREAYPETILEFIVTNVTVRILVDMTEQDGSIFQKLEELVELGFEVDMGTMDGNSSVVEITIRAEIMKRPNVEYMSSDEPNKIIDNEYKPLLSRSPEEDY